MGAVICVIKEKDGNNCKITNYQVTKKEYLQKNNLQGSKQNNIYAVSSNINKESHNNMW